MGPLFERIAADVRAARSDHTIKGRCGLSAIKKKGGKSKKILGGSFNSVD